MLCRGMLTPSTRLWLGALCAALGAQAALETWHLVDLAAAICPKPSNVSYQYAVGINLTSDIAGEMPYIISFMRKSTKPMSISFKMLDSEGTEVLSETSVELGGVNASVPKGCECIGSAPPGVNEEVYGQGYGSSCKAWDEQKCGEWWGDNMTGSWCCAQWCYATSSCPDAYTSSLDSTYSYSYKACSNSSSQTRQETCPWIKKATERNPCACRNSSELFTIKMKAKFSSDYGSSCSAWDMDTCAEDYTPDKVDTWCCKDWCYVDEKCPSSIPSFNEDAKNTLFWSSNVCRHDAAKIAQCPYKPEPLKNNTAVARGSCECLNETMPANLLPLGVPADFGNGCASHDAERCNTLYPGAKTDMWCCMSWCWVSPNCPGSQESTHWPGHFWSQAGCDMDVDLISGCPWNPTACQCIASPGSAVLNKNGGKFPNDYGSSCKAWDENACKSTWGGSQGWNGSDHEWCCDSWCYVSNDCPIAKKSWLGLEYVFSYETCDDSNKTYKETTDSCEAPSRRVAAPRRLAGRRRWGGSSWGSSYSSYSSSSWSSRSRSSSSWSWSSGRRRSPPAPPTWSRRRGITAPSAPRRRSAYNMNYNLGSVLTFRRRWVSVLASTSSRRRSSDISGKTYSTARRRDPFGSPRRRASYNGGYGYVNRQMMFQNCPLMPNRYSYGYSCYASVPEDEQVNIAIYAGGGSDEASSYFNADYGYHRYTGRRRDNGANNGWCIVPACGDNCWNYDQPGNLIQCDTCRWRYNFCLSSNECHSSSGCGYSTKAAFNRDDLAQTGFIPQDYKGPFSIVFTRIVSEDFHEDPRSSNMCPPQTAAEKDHWEKNNMTQAIKADLFVLLTRQEKLSEPCKRELSFSCISWCMYDANAYCDESRPIKNGLMTQNRCTCNPGYCIKDGACEPDPSLELLSTSAPPSTFAPPSPPPSWNSQHPGCHDNRYDCAEMARMGDCSQNRDYMVEVCRRTCNACALADGIANDRSPRWLGLMIPAWLLALSL